MKEAGARDDFKLRDDSIERIDTSDHNKQNQTSRIKPQNATVHRIVPLFPTLPVDKVLPGAFHIELIHLCEERHQFL